MEKAVQKVRVGSETVDVASRKVRTSLRQGGDVVAPRGRKNTLVLLLPLQSLPVPWLAQLAPWTGFTIFGFIRV